MNDVIALTEQLSHYYWSDKFPNMYVIEPGVGLGHVAHQDFGAFNVAWASYDIDKPQSRSELVERQIRALMVFNAQRKYNKQLIHNTPLGFWLTRLNRVEFMAWARDNHHLVNPKALRNMDLVLRGTRL
jgi:hypothetical protein